MYILMRVQFEQFLRDYCKIMMFRVRNKMHNEN